MTDEQLIPPDYSEAAKAESENPKEDESDVLEEMLPEEDEAEDRKIEALLDEQAALNDNLQNNNYSNEMSNSFGSGPSWNSGSTPWSSGSNSGTGGNNEAPWNKNNNGQGNNGPAWKPQTGNSWSSWGSGNGGNNQSSWNSRDNNQPTVNVVGHRDVVICDVLDCLVESYTSEGRPNVVPRAVFDMKFKFDIWDRIAALSPKKLCIILPDPESIPSFGNSASARSAMEYLTQSLSVYLRIDRRDCIVFRTMRPNQMKDKALRGIMKAIRANDPSKLIYVGVYCGDWGLSTADKDAAERCGIDCVSIYHLLGKI